MVKSRYRVHYRITLFLIGDYKVYHFVSLLRAEGQMLRTREWSMKIQRDHLKVRTILHIFDDLGHVVDIKDVNRHIRAQCRMVTGRHVLFEPFERALSANGVVVFAYSVHRNPYTVSRRTGKVLLGISGYGATKKTYGMSEGA